MTKEQSLPEWAKDHFPKNSGEAKSWQSYTTKHALAMRVLVVAHTRTEGAWCAYIDAVPGINHDNEVAEVLRYGDKLGEDIALMLFPEFKGIPYAK